MESTEVRVFLWTQRTGIKANGKVGQVSPTVVNCACLQKLHVVMVFARKLLEASKHVL